MSRLRRRAVLGLTLLLVLLPDCARDLVAVDGGWRSQREGYRIGEPGPGWTRIELEGAALAFRRGGAETMSLQSRCGRPVASPEIMARHLMIGIPERTLREVHPATVSGHAAWSQTFDARLEGRTARVESVTVVTSGCAYDFLMVTAEDSESAERDFQTWVAGFTLPEVDTAGAAR